MSDAAQAVICEIIIAYTWQRRTDKGGLPHHWLQMKSVVCHAQTSSSRSCLYHSHYKRALRQDIYGKFNSPQVLRLHWLLWSSDVMHSVMQGLKQWLRQCV